MARRTRPGQRQARQGERACADRAGAVVYARAIGPRVVSEERARIDGDHRREPPSAGQGKYASVQRSAQAVPRCDGADRRHRRVRRKEGRMNPLESWTEEQRSAYLYRACAAAEAGTVRAELFRRLAGEAEAQAAIWRAQLTAKGHPAPAPFAPDARTRLVAWLVARFGPRRLRGILAAMKV